MGIRTGTCAQNRIRSWHDCVVGFGDCPMEQHDWRIILLFAVFLYFGLSAMPWPALILIYALIAWKIGGPYLGIGTAAGLVVHRCHGHLAGGYAVDLSLWDRSADFFRARCHHRHLGSA